MKKTKAASTPNHIRIPTIKTHKTRSEWTRAMWDILLSHLCSLKDKGTLKAFMELIVTPHERATIVRRAAAIQQLKHNVRYVDICRELFIAPQTLTSLKKALTEHQYRSYRERGKTERRKKVYSSSPQKSKKIPTRKKRTKYGTISTPFPY